MGITLVQLHNIVMVTPQSQNVHKLPQKRIRPAVLNSF